MDRHEVARRAHRLKTTQPELFSADTPANEERLRKLLATRAMLLERARSHGPRRYRLKFPDGSCADPVALLDVEKMLAAMDKDAEKGSATSRGTTSVSQR